MANKAATASGGVGLPGLLGVAFIVLKLCEVIDWSWWWVTCPFWALPAVALAIIVGIGAVYLWGAIMDEWDMARRNRKRP